MKKRIGSFLVFGLMAVLVSGYTAAYAAEQYQTEISPEYLRSDSDDNFRVIMAGFNAEMFFAPVNTADHPYAEAAFLERIGSVFISAARVDTKDDVLKGDGMFYGAGINVAKPGCPLAVRATYAATKIDYTEPATGNLKISEYGIRAGYYFLPTLLAGVEYDHTKRDFALAGFRGVSDKRADYGFFAKYVHELRGGREMSFEAALGTSSFDDGTETLTNTRESLDLDYFFNRGLSAGVGIENNSGKDKSREGRTYSANVNAFITPMFSVKALYERFLNSNHGEPSDRTIDVLLAARF
jgi:Putative general bacterial porin